MNDEWCRDESCTWRHWQSGSMPTHRIGADCPAAHSSQESTTMGEKYTPSEESTRSLIVEMTETITRDNEAAQENGHQFDQLMAEARAEAFDAGWIARAQLEPAHRLRSWSLPAPPPARANPYRRDT